jgi:ariadne-1
MEYDIDYNPEDYYNEIEYDIPLGRQSSYTVIKATELEKIRNNLISDVSEFTCLSAEDASLILINNQWNIERIKDIWYDNTDENKQKCGLELSKESITNLKEKNIIPNNKFCNICYSEWDKTFFSLTCNHKFCGDCWKDYLTTRLDDVLTTVCTTCPQNGCSLIVPENIFRRFLPNDKLLIYEKAVYKNFTDNNVDIRWCPTPNCDICIRCIAHSMKEIVCECKNVFCFKCGKEAHRPCICEMVELWNQKNSSESENVKWLLANTKQCPKCHKYIEKNQGCNHMTCRKEAGGCSFEFCWICLGEWAPHGSSYYNCNKYDPNIEENKKKEATSKNAKYELERYVFFFDRYMNHDKAKNLSIAMREIIQKEIQDFSRLKNLPYEELKFMEEAVETIIKARRTLKNTYIFGFYMKNVNQRQLFEHNQYLLESNADRLHEMMENETKKKLLDICIFEDFTKEWTLFKANVTNLSSATLKYLENLLIEIENNMMDLVELKNN